MLSKLALGLSHETGTKTSHSFSISPWQSTLPENTRDKGPGHLVELEGLGSDREWWSVIRRSYEFASSRPGGGGFSAMAWCGLHQTQCTSAERAGDRGRCGVFWSAHGCVLEGEKEWGGRRKIRNNVWHNYTAVCPRSAVLGLGEGRTAVQ